MTGNRTGLSLRRAGAIWLCLLFVGLGLFAFSVSSPLAQEPQGQAQDQEQRYAPQGADSCLVCHNNSDITPILSTPHARVSDARTPFANHACESCHGASPDHLSTLASPAVVFGLGGGLFPASEPAIQNQMCLGCHQSGARVHWAASEHQTADLACVSCHKIHASQDNVLSSLTQPDVCFSCHQDKRAELNRRSHHPVTEGLVSCSDCHNPHGSVSFSLLARNTVNETCTQCHAEKRGPYLWEHQPVTEECTICHNPHGSTQPRLLSIRLPFLCQTCHQESYHQSALYSGDDIPPVGAAQQLLGGSCTNCHSRIHGSNHPSGSRFTR